MIFKRQNFKYVLHLFQVFGDFQLRLVKSVVFCSAQAGGQGGKVEEEERCCKSEKQATLSKQGWSISFVFIFYIQGVFFTGPPPKKLKYVKLRLGEVTCI